MPIFLVFFLFFVTFYLAYFYIEEFRRKQTLPPGPPVFPLVGSVASLFLAHSKPHLAILNLSKKYGDLMRLRMGAHEYVVLSSFEVQSDLLSNDVSLGRPNHGALLDLNADPDMGIETSSGEIWKSKRVWMRRAFKQMGIGRTSFFEESIRSMLSDLHNNLRVDLSQSGKVITVDNSTSFSADSLIWSILVGSNTPEDVADCKRFLHATDLFLEGGAFSNGIVILAPFLKNISPSFTNHTNLVNLVTLGHSLAQKLYNKLVTLEGDHPHNFYHSYILEQKTGRQGFSEIGFKITFTDIMIGGLDTTNAYLKTLLLFLTKYPEEQEKIYKEISDKFPSCHDFTMADLKSLPYTQAFMLEVHRVAVIITNWLPRTLTADLNYRGYSFKKGTTLLPNPHASFKSLINFGPDPETFRPERFIDPLDSSKLSQLKKVITPFSIGKRVCPGESIAETVSFLMLVSTVRNFRLSCVPGEAPPSLELCVGMLAKPAPFRILINTRL